MALERNYASHNGSTGSEYLFRNELNHGALYRCVSGLPRDALRNEEGISLEAELRLFGVSSRLPIVVRVNFGTVLM